MVSNKNKQMKKNIIVRWWKIYWTMFVLGLLISIGGLLFLDVSITSSFVTYIVNIDHPFELSDEYFHILKFMQINTIAVGILLIILSTLLLYKQYKQKKKEESQKFEIDYDIKRLIISSCIIIGFSIIFCFSVVIQTAYVEHLYYTMNGLNDEEKRVIQFGDFYKFVENCSEQIPENENILMLSNYSSPIGYYLYPRKLYRYPNVSVSLENISKDWLDEKGIKWALSHCGYQNFSLNESRIIKLDEAKNV